MHSSAEGESEYVPAKHVVHELSSAMYSPFAQALQYDAPGLDVMCGIQYKHSDIPKVGAYVPAKHFWHADPPTGKYVPGEQEVPT